MNLLTVLTPSAIAIALVVLGLLSLFCIAIVGMSYLHYRRLIFLQHEQLTVVREDLAALCKGSLGLGERVARLDTRLNTLAKRQEHFELQETPQRSYMHAIKLVQKGANVEDLMTDCGLARGEAELVLLSKQLDRSA